MSLAVDAVQGVAYAETFEGVRLLQLRSDAGRDLQGFLVLGARQWRLVGAVSRASDVVQGLGFTGAVAQVAAQNDPFQDSLKVDL